MDKTEYLDHYETLLTGGLAKLGTSAGFLNGEIVSNPDIDGRWDNEFAAAYIADAVVNYNSYPDAAIAWAAFLGMAVAFQWDSDWMGHRSDPYPSYYGPRGWDDMDEHVLYSMLQLDRDQASALNSFFLACSEAARGLIRHEGIEAQTDTGFYILARTYTVMYRLGAAVQLQRMGYKKINVKI